MRLAAGNNHSCVVRTDGALRCWGGNSVGQLGNGGTADATSPVTPTGLGSGVVAVAAGNAHTCAITQGGGVKCWGDNLNGQLGDGSSTQRNTPVEVVGLSSGVTTLEAGDNHTCAGLASGGVRCWGWGTSGQLGQDGGSSQVPVAVVGLPAGTTATSIAAGYRHTCATLSNGATYCWGRNNEGQLGIGNNTTSRTAVLPVGLGSGSIHTAAGGAHTCVATAGGPRCFGLNNAGQLGNGTTANSNVPVEVQGFTGSTATRMAVGGSHSCGLTPEGGVRCWGLNQDGQLGINDPDVNNTTSARSVNGLSSGQVEISSGVSHTCSLASNGSVRCWGANDSGQLGNGTTTKSFTPVAVVGI